MSDQPVVGRITNLAPTVDKPEWSGTITGIPEEIERLRREVAELLYVVRKAAEWDADNTDNADLAALGAYARAALSKCHAQGTV